MSASYREINVRLHRDAFNTPWGFRLQGGRDFKGPLTVQRVFVGSPADGELQRGDVIVSIEKHAAGYMVHKQAQDIIKAAGGTLELTVKRGLQQRFGVEGVRAQSTPTAHPQGFRSRGLDTFTPKPDPKIGAFSPTKSGPTFTPGMSTDFGTEYGAGHKYGKKTAPRGTMLNRVNQSLTSAIWDEDDIDYSQRSIHDLRSAFSGPTHVYTSYKPPTRTSKPHHTWQKPTGGYGSVPAGLAEPGWTASTAPKQTEMGWTPAKQHVPQHIPQESYLEKQSRPAPRPVNRPATGHTHTRAANQEIYHEDTGTPAWAGSLRGAGGPKPWEVHAAAAALSPSDHPPPQQQAASPRQPTQNAAEGSAFQPHQPRVQNVHYGPGATTPQYQQVNPSQADHTDSARVVHLQYNSPLQLYSRDNAEDVLKGQTGGKPGSGSMVITGGGGGKILDLSKSETYRLIHEQERGGPRSARYVEHRPGQEMQYHGYQDQKKQSPSMQALQHYVGEAPPSPQGHTLVTHGQGQPVAIDGERGGEDGTGYSDF